MKIVTVIPARGGSKSIPKKNIQLLLDKPLIAYSIEYSLNSPSVSKTIVSSDSQEICEIAKNHGAEVPFIRPKNISKDDSRDFDFMKHALDFFEDKDQIFDLFILLRPTSPLRPLKLIERGIEIAESYPDMTSIRSVARVKEHPYRTWMLNNEGYMESFVQDETEPYNWPRQDLPILYFQTGDIEISRRETLLSGSVTGDRPYPLIIDHEEMVDIDNWQDLDLAAKRIQ